MKSTILSPCLPLKVNESQLTSEKRGQQDLRERAECYLDFETEFGHLEGGTIVGKGRKSAAVITLVERLLKPSSP